MTYTSDEYDENDDVRELNSIPMPPTGSNSRSNGERQIRRRSSKGPHSPSTRFCMADISSSFSLRWVPQSQVQMRTDSGSHLEWGSLPELCPPRARCVCVQGFEYRDTTLTVGWWVGHASSSLLFLSFPECTFLGPSRKRWVAHFIISHFSLEHTDTLLSHPRTASRSRAPQRHDRDGYGLAQTSF